MSIEDIRLRNFRNRYGPEYLPGMAKFARLSRIIHTGIDENGNPLSSEEQQQLRSNLEEHRQQIATKYFGGDTSQVGIPRGLEDAIIRRFYQHPGD